MIYSGCGCEVIEHFPNFCPDCHIEVLECEVAMWRRHVPELEAELAFCQRIIKQGSGDLTGEQVAYIFDLSEEQHE